MKITFISNYINHHQIPLCDALYKLLGDDFNFIQCIDMEEERAQMGWGVDLNEYPYVSVYGQRESFCKYMIKSSDVLMLGWSSVPEIDEMVLEAGCPVLRLSERIYREGQWKAISPKGLKNKYHEHIKYRNSQVYLLCAGAYVASDFNLIHAYPGKKYRWGYFPPTMELSEDELREKFARKKDSEAAVELMWAGRFITLKHPEFAVRAVADLTKLGKKVHLTMIGDGELLADMKKLAADSGVADKITFRGGLLPAEVRAKMLWADIYLFTSNYLEGWGAVVNEAMNAACAVVASREAGCVPYLIEDGVNGFAYNGGNYEKMLEKLLRLVDDADLTENFGRNAYDTIMDTWNAEKAAEALIRFCKGLYDGRDPQPEAEGPLSIAPVIKPPAAIRTFQEDNHLQ